MKDTKILVVHLHKSQRPKLKERMEGKDAAVMISEDDDNNSFLQKSEGQDEKTKNSRKIPETSDKDQRRFKY